MLILGIASQIYTRNSDAKTAVLHPSIPSPARRIGEKSIELVRRVVIFDDCITETSTQQYERRTITTDVNGEDDIASISERQINGV